jgi:hypothetical protein
MDAGEPAERLVREERTRVLATLIRAIGDIDLAQDAVQAAIVRALERWADLYLQKSSWFENPEKPVLFGWQMIVSPEGATQRLMAERNPFYWKVDPDGSQLPYIDRVVFEAHSTVDTLLLSVLAGEVDMHALEFNTLQNRPVVSQSRDSGDYGVFDLVHPGHVELLEAARRRTGESTRTVESYEEFREEIEAGGFIYAHWDGTAETEVKIKEETKATIRLIPFGDADAGQCMVTGKPSEKRVLFARSY